MVQKFHKYPDSITAGIDKMKNFKIKIVRNRDWQNEHGAYVWESINGILTNRPTDGNNHYFDAARYLVDGYIFHKAVYYGFIR